MATWREDIVAALERLGGIAHLRDIYKEVSKIRTVPLTRTYEATIRQVIESHSSDSQVFTGKDIFYSVEGLGGGIWGLRAMVPHTPRSSDLYSPELPDRALCETYRILRDTVLAREIKQLYNNQCQLCATTIYLQKGATYSEAHHIQPLGTPHNGPDVAENIIVLCPNHHVMCDYGTIKLEVESLRKHPNHKVGINYITYHNNKIYK